MSPMDAAEEEVCERKRRFASRTEAAVEASRRRKIHPTFVVECYPCRVCGGWHWARPQMKGAREIR